MVVVAVSRQMSLPATALSPSRPGSRRRSPRASFWQEIDESWHLRVAGGDFWIEVGCPWWLCGVNQ
jgi:hypothetical protein